MIDCTETTTIVKLKQLYQAKLADKPDDFIDCYNVTHKGKKLTNRMTVSEVEGLTDGESLCFIKYDNIYIKKEHTVGDGCVIKRWHMKYKPDKKAACTDFFAKFM